MNSLRATNWLLLAILLGLLCDVGLRLAERPAAAETFQLDQCITPTPGDKPSGYLHVVTHPYAGQ